MRGRVRQLLGIVGLLILAFTLTWVVSNAETQTAPSLATNGWELYHTGKNNWLKDVQFVNEYLGYAVGESNQVLWYGPNSRYRGSILRTTDGGRTWEEMYTLPARQFEMRAMRGIHMISEYEGWAVGDLGRILHTIDGFQTWEVQRSGHDKPQFDVFFSPDGKYGWVGTSPNAGHLVRTTDGGRTWISGMGTPAPWGASTESMDWIKVGNRWYGYAIASVSTGGLFVRSTDGGRTWRRPRPDLADVHVHQVDFVDATHGWVAANNGRIYYTTDGGETWRYVQLDTNLHVMDVQFLDRYRGYAVAARCPYPPNYWFQCTTSPDGTGKRISAQVVFLTTTDGGRTWQLQDLPGQDVPVSLFVLDPNHIWIVGERGMVLRYNAGPVLPTATPQPPATATPTPKPTATPTPTPVASSGRIVLQQGRNNYRGTIDTYIERWWPNGHTNYGDKPYLRVRGEDKYGVTLEALVRFDLSNLPDNIIVRRARLQLYSAARNRDVPGQFKVYMLRRRWQEMVATFYTASQQEAWEVPGALGTTDRDPTPIAQVTFDKTYAWLSFNVTKAVQEWVSGKQPNYGFIVQGFVVPGYPAVQHTFLSSEDPHVNLRPRLVIEYEIATPTPVPTPTPTHTFTPTPSPTPQPTNTPPATPTQPAYGPPVTVRLQEGMDGYNAARDTYISRWYRSSNFGRAPILYVRTEDGAGPTHELLFFFRLDQVVPQGARVERAALRLYSASRNRNAAILLRAYRVLAPWSETQATWLQAANGRPWEQAGAFGSQDRDPTPVGETVFNATHTWLEIDVTSAVSEWASNPSANFGLLVQGFRYNNGPQVQHSILSSEYPAANLRPVLEITYREPIATPPTPTPTSTLPVSPLPTPTPVASSTPTVPPTATPTATATWTPTATPTFTPTPTPTPSPTPTAIVYGPPETIQLREGVDGYKGAADTYISRWYRTSRYGWNAYMFVRTEDSFGPTNETLIYFSLKDVLPQDAIVQRAVLKLYVASRNRNVPIVLRAYRLKRAWKEGQATWVQASNTTAWGQPGALASSDRFLTPVSEVTFNSAFTWLEMDVTKAVRAWLRKPANNHGLVIQGFTASGGVQVQYRFASSQYPGVTLRPVLEITYQAPIVGGPVPSPTPTANPTQPATATPTPLPPAPTATPIPVPTGTVTPGPGGWSAIRNPGIYLAYDYQGHNRAAFGTVGSLASFHWSQLENQKGKYTFGVIDNWLNKLAAYGLKGAFFVDVFDGGCDGDRALPQYIINDSRAVLRRNLGYRCPQSGRTWKAIPNYMSSYFQNRYRLLIMRLGERYKNDPRVEFIAIGTGIYGETRAAADSADLNVLRNAGLTSETWIDYANKVALWHYQAFSDSNGRLLKPLLQQTAATTFAPWERREISNYALSLGIGVSLNLMYPDGEGVVYLGNAGCPMCGWYDYPLLYWNVIPTAWEAYEHQTCTPELIWWGVYNVLNKHPVYLRVAARMVRTNTGAPRTENVAPFKWAAKYMGVTAKNAPSAWVALREHRDPWIPLTCLNVNTAAPHQKPQWGNYGFFMDQRDDLPGGRTVPETNDKRVKRMGNNSNPYNPLLPPGKEGWAVRRTDEATGNPYMFFDVDSAYLKGIQSVTIKVTYWDYGTDTWSLYYRNSKGRVVRGYTVQKRNTRQWKTVSITLTGVKFNNSLPAGTGGADFYISSNNDGDEWIHFVEVIRR